MKKFMVLYMASKAELEKMMKNSSGFSLPFLSSHPSDQERIERFKALIESKRQRQSEAAAQ